MKFHGKRILVTGATKGIARAVAALREGGATVLTTARKRPVIWGAASFIRGVRYNRLQQPYIGLVSRLSFTRTIVSRDRASMKSTND
jgi:NAD(P)-dependent dehydrogenase (short-subunit alcohol dehydrogenase family)